MMHDPSSRLLHRIGALMFAPALALVACKLSADASAPGDPLYDGYRIYELGLLPDGSPVRAWRPEGITRTGSEAACTSCHRRSGMGSIEGSVERTVLVPPVAGAVLFAPSVYQNTFLDPNHHYQPNPAWTRVMTRSAYDAPSFARAMRAGVDPGGKPLQAPMPRYDLDTAALTALAAYLRSLSAAPDPGVDDDALHLATVITPDAPAGQAETVLGVLRAWSASARGAGKPWQLHEWVLRGPPDGWHEQLAAYYREQPVFAVLSGSGGAGWQQVQDFCEASRLPCIFPALEQAPERTDGHFPVYFSPGVLLEARVLGRHLQDQPAVGRALDIVQVYDDASGAAAAATLRRELAGKGSIVDRQYRADAPAAVLDGLRAGQLLVLWLRGSAVEALAAAQPDAGPVLRIFVSDLLAPSATRSLSPAWKQRVNVVSLFDDLGIQGEIARLRLQGWLERAGLPSAGDLRVQADVYTACYLFNKASAEIRAQEVRRPSVPLSREHVLEMLEVLTSKYSDGTALVDPDSHVAYYGRMSLGPGQRMAVRGGVILHYPSPQAKRLVKLGARIVP